MSLKNELCDIRMKIDDIVASYFVRISQLRDQIQSIYETISKRELVTVKLNGLPRSWDAFAISISRWKEAPLFKPLWTYCA